MKTIETSSDRRVKKSKKALKNALITLMDQKDFKDISITNIVELADVNRGTFYRHYQYKEDLLEDLTNDVLSDLIWAYRFPYVHLDTFDVSTLSSNSIKIFEHVQRHALFYKLIFSSDFLYDYQQRIYQTLKNINIEDFEYALIDPKINRNLHISYQANAIIGMIMEWVKEDFCYPTEYMAEQLLAFIHSTHSSPSKIKILN
ncbi:TetR/AcrR family transcriptional regulator [Niallia sp.]|uniref:TetR/AcrR family transcriptional regulator n=1 Tax=Niallia sp. TaxID=2837523 RepID=UPI0028A1AAAE|nr:TetR/AcrR family transcriptional regulator [Niallia sp.]